MGEPYTVVARGRKFHNFYENLQFNSLRLSNGRPAAKCLVCDVVLKNTSITRLQKHRNMCYTIPVSSSYEELSDNNDSFGLEVMNQNINSNKDETGDLKLNIINTNLGTLSELVEKEIPTAGPSTPRTSSVESLSSIQNVNFKAKNRCIKKITSFVDNVPQESKETIDLALAKFFFGCNIPFSVVESDHFKNFIKIIRPSYQLPSQSTLSTSLLDKVHNELKNSNKKNINCNNTSLIIDGWENSSNNNKNIVTMLQSVGGHSLFLESHEFSTTQETGEALSYICEQSIVMAKEKYGCDIYAVVSNNALNKIKMKHITNLWHSACSSHTGNILIKNVLNHELIEKLITILKHFKRTDLENELVNIGGSRIILPTETRWSSNLDACVFLIKNLKALKKISAEDFQMNSSVTNIMYDDDFITEIKNTITLLNPICELINKCQEIDCSIADSAEEWLTLIDKIPEEVKTEQINEKLLHGIDMGLNMYSITANYLSPKYRGKKLNSSQISIAQEFLLDNLDSDGLDSLYAYEKENDMFEKLFQKNVTSPNTFWGLADRKHSSLATLALKLMRIPASSAQLERIFSNGSFVHSTLDNHLTPERSSKLIFVYYSLKISDSNKSDQY